MRWTIRRAEVWHGQEGYKLVVSDTAWWALAVSVAYDRLMDVLGHPCCGRGIGRVGPVCDAAWRLLQSTASVAWDHTVRLAELPVDEGRGAGVVARRLGRLARDAVGRRLIARGDRLAGSIQPKRLPPRQRRRDCSRTTRHGVAATVADSTRSDWAFTESHPLRTGVPSGP